MKSISQIANLTGVSTRTLQYYDEIGLLKPSKLTAAGYRMYDEKALQTLQEILFFRELGFPLKEIKQILQQPHFDKINAFKKQKELFILKRNRLDRLIQLLERLERGENCMSFKEFDLSDYISALEDFKCSQSQTVIQYWGSIANFDMFIQKIKEDEDQVARLAVQQFGSIEKYTEAMKYNLEHFSEIAEYWQSQIPPESRTDDKFLALASHKEEDAASEPVQSIVSEIVEAAVKVGPDAQVGNTEKYCHAVIEIYSTDYFGKIIDAKYGNGSSAYIVKAFRLYLENSALQHTGQ